MISDAGDVSKKEEKVWEAPGARRKAGSVARVRTISSISEDLGSRRGRTEAYFFRQGKWYQEGDQRTKRRRTLRFERKGRSGGVEFGGRPSEIKQSTSPTRNSKKNKKGGMMSDFHQAITSSIIRDKDGVANRAPR